MLTIGGLIYDSSQKTQVDKMAFDNFSFYKDGNDSYKIQSPNLTFREIKALDKALPPDYQEVVDDKFINERLQNIPLIKKDIVNYAKIYRYFPNYTEANL